MLLSMTFAFCLNSTLERDIQALLPTEEENRFLAIAWRENLLGAAQEAAQKKRPLFLWMMNGHPLGCT